MAEDRETTAQRDARVEAVERERADRAEKAPLTGVLTQHDVLRHLVRYGSGGGEAQQAELLGVINDADPDYRDPDAKPGDGKTETSGSADTGSGPAKPADSSKGTAQ